jgi:hypothetical protein
MEDWKDKLKHYQEFDNIKDEDLLKEAIATCENIFSLMDENELLHHSRPLVIAYLALKHEERKKNS